jgi:hypothetical protein
MTEILFRSLMQEVIKQAVLADGQNDGVCTILEIGMDNCVNIHGCTDILSAYVSPMGGLTFLVSDNEDKHQFFVGIEEIPMEILEKIVSGINEYKADGTAFEV